jgi:hypothetical protein
VANVYNPIYSGGRDRKIVSASPDKGKLASPYLKNKKAVAVAQVVEHVPSMYKVMDSIISTIKIK